MRDRKGAAIPVRPFVLHPDRTSFPPCSAHIKLLNPRRERAILQQMEQMVDMYFPCTLLKSRHACFPEETTKAWVV
jgi:hypothetical protein